MEDLEVGWNEPLNLCKKKKPVAVVAPSSVVEEQALDFSKDGCREEGDQEAGKRSVLVRPAAEYHSFYSMIRSLAACEQGFLTAMYMGGLVNSGLLGYPPGFHYPPSPAPGPLKPSPTYPLSVPKVDLKIPNPSELNIPSLKASKPIDEKPSPRKTSSMEHKNSSSSANDVSKGQDSGHPSNNQDKKKPHIKKPLNAFMLYMKEMRAKVVAECTLKESAAINQILGRRWHSLSREEQAKYYEKARVERQLHMELYPGWSARDNYGYGTKKKKRKKERVTIQDSGGNSMKKCRARYGLDQQSQWCKPCRRKKKCIRYKECGDDGTASEDGGRGSCGGSIGDGGGGTGDEGELSSPGGLSALSSLTSPSMASPLTPSDLGQDVKPPLPLPMPLPLPLPLPLPQRHPVGTNPHDINNPLSVNQLTGKSGSSSKAQRTVISVP